MALPNPKFDADIVKQILVITGGDKQKLFEMFNDPKQEHLKPAILLADMESQALKRNEEIKQGQGQGQGKPPTVAAARGLTSPPPPSGGLGAIATQGGGMPAPPPSAPPAGLGAMPPVGMAAGGMTELPEPNNPYNTNAGGGLTTLPIPDSMYNEESFAGGGIVAFAAGDSVEANKEAEAWEASVAMERKYGVPARLTFAQWKLESGGGKRMPPGSNNPFGVKATGNSPYVEANTTEFVNGKPVRTKEKFRKYDSIIDAFEGRTKMLATSPLYKEARESGYDPFVLGSVYATDPRYGEKIASLMQDVPKTPTRTQVARAEPPMPNIAAPRVPTVEAPSFTVADTPSLGSQALRVASAFNPIGTAQAAEKPAAPTTPAAPKEWEAPFGKPEYLPMYTPGTLDPEEKMTAPQRLLGTGVIDYFHGLGNVPIAGARGLAEAGNRVADFFTRPVGMPRKGAPNAPPPAAPPTAARDTTPIGQNYGGRYIMGSDPEAEARLLGRTLPPKKSPEDERFDAFMARMGDLPKYPGMSAEERAQQRAQDRNDALFFAAMQGLSKGSTTFTGALGDTGAAYAQAAMASNKEQKALDREQREIAYKEALEGYKTRGEAAKYALGIGESAEENFLRRYAKASPEERKLMEAGMAARSPYGNLSAILQQNKVSIEDIDRQINDLKRAPLTNLKQLGIVDEAGRNEAIRRLQQERSVIASGGGGLGGSGGGNVVNVPWS